MTHDAQLSADYSRDIGEPMYGSIKPADVFFLLEYNGLFTQKAWEDAGITQDVKDKLEQYPNSKTLLIRRPARATALDRKTTLYIVDTDNLKPHWYRLDFDKYTDILDLDFDAVLQGKVVDSDSTPLFVVCTNGKRDVCCATYGMEVYMTLEATYHDAVWQCSHFGGHRFAGTLLAFPHGYCYGRLNAESAPIVAQSYQHGRVSNPYLRGRTSYPQYAQAAEYFIREDLSEYTMSSVRYLASAWDGDVGYVRFAVEDAMYLVIVREGDPLEVIGTTGKDTMKTVHPFVLVSIARLDMA